MRADKDKLYQLFQESKTMIPEVDLEYDVMQKIRLASQKKKERQHFFYVVSLVGALLTTLIVPLAVLYFYGLLPSVELQIDLSGFMNLKGIFEFVNFKSPYLFIPYIIFFLLICDLLIRKKIWNRDHSQNKDHQ